MITYFLLNAIIGALFLVTAPLGQLPNATLDPRFAAALATIGQQVSYVRVVIPDTMTTIFIIIGVIIVVEGFIFGYKVVMWIIKKIPTIN